MRGPVERTPRRRAALAAACALALAACALALAACAAGPGAAPGEDPGLAAATSLGEAPAEAADEDPARPADEDPARPGDEDPARPGDEAPVEADGAAPVGREPTGEALAARMDAYLDENFPRVGMPGAAVAVVDADGVRYLGTLGDCPGADAPFLVGSLSKSFTAVAVMQLVEQGAVELDAPAARYAAGYDVPAEITVRSLLNQTSGFSAHDSLDEAADGRLGATFGSFSYANANYDLLGRVVEGASGEPYARYLEEHVLDPLGMSETSADPSRAPGHGMAPGHRDWFGLHLADGFEHAQGDGAWGGPASGYVSSSIEDMAAYLRMYLNGGAAGDGARVLSPDGVRSMFLDRVPDPGGDTCYGMGWTSFNWDDGELVLSHDGQVENYVASMCLVPDRGIGIVVLGDANDNAGGNSRFFDLVGGAVSVAVGGSPEPVDVQWTALWRQRTDVLYACALLACAAPLLVLGRWRRRLALAPRRRLLAQGIALHAILPAVLLALPLWWGTPWRDLLDFAPDASLVLALGAVLLAVAGVAKLALAMRWRSDAAPAAHVP